MHRRFFLPATTIAAVAMLSAAQHAAADLAHRYSFTANANDSVGTANGTVIDAGAPTAVFAGGQLDLSGNAGEGSNGITNDAYVNFPNGMISSTATAGNGALSFELWATVSTTRTWQRYIDFGTSDGGEDASPGAGNAPYLYISPNSGRFGDGLATETHQPGGGGNEVGQTGPLPNDVQIHVVGTYDHNDLTAGPNGTMKLYRDGALVGADDISPLLNLRTFTDVNNWLGRAQWNDAVFDGLFNELRIYDHALNGAEVAVNSTLGPDVLNSGGIVSVEVNKNTGAVTLTNGSPIPFALDFYRLSSAGGALSVANWNSLDDQNYDAVDGADLGSIAGDSVGEGWDQAGGSDANELVEHFLSGAGSTIAPNETLSLGNAFNTAIFGAGNDGDLQFEFGLNSGGSILGNVTYVGGGGQQGDFDTDGDVDGNDFLVWQRGDAPGGLTGGNLTTWRANYGAPAVAAAGAVPEPSSIVLMLAAGLLLAARRAQS